MMPGDLRNKEVALSRLKRLASSGLPLEPFVRSVFELSNDAVPHHANKAFLAGGPDRVEAYFGSTPETEAAVPLHTRFLVESPPEVSGAHFRMTPSAMRQIMPSRTIWQHHDIWRPGFHRAEGYNEVHRPLGWSQLVLVAYHEAKEFFGFYPIWRGSDQKPFSRDDISFLQASAPHIAHGLRTAHLLQREPADGDGFAAVSGWGSGVVLMDRGGKPIAMDAEARLIFQQLGVLDGVSADAFASRPLRDALGYVMYSLRSIFSEPGGDSWAAGAPVYRLYHHWTGIILKLRGIRMFGLDGPEYATVLIERGETAGSRRRRMLIKWGLSAREAEVLSLIAEGKTGLEISILLSIKHDTVRKHTSHIFEKLGVETRTAAAAMALETMPGKHSYERDLK
jgi:DNA-binding CsgD family transcriptional regulator